jgi:hypothetical protein
VGHAAYRSRYKHSRIPIRCHKIQPSTSEERWPHTLYSLLPVRGDIKLLFGPGESWKLVQVKNVCFCATFCGYEVMFSVPWRACDAPQWVNDETLCSKAWCLTKLFLLSDSLLIMRVLVLGFRNLIRWFSSPIPRRLIAKDRITINAELEFRWTEVLLIWCFCFFSVAQCRNPEFSVLANFEYYPRIRVENWVIPRETCQWVSLIS